MKLQIISEIAKTGNQGGLFFDPQVDCARRNQFFERCTNGISLLSFHIFYIDFYSW